MVAAHRQPRIRTHTLFIGSCRNCHESCHTCSHRQPRIRTPHSAEWVCWMSHVTRVVSNVTHVSTKNRHNFSHTCEWVTSHIWMSHVRHTNESCHTCESWVMSHMCMSHVTHANESCHTDEWVMSYFVNESCHTYGWVLSHIWKSHVTHIDESCHTCEWVFDHTCVAASVRDTQRESVTHKVSARHRIRARDTQFKRVTHNLSAWHTIWVYDTMWVRDTQFECVTQNLSARYTLWVHGTQCECVAPNVSAQHTMWVRDTQFEHDAMLQQRSPSSTLSLPLSLLLSLSLASVHVPQLPSMYQYTRTSGGTCINWETRQISITIDSNVRNVWFKRAKRMFHILMTCLIFVCVTQGLYQLTLSISIDSIYINWLYINYQSRITGQAETRLCIARVPILHLHARQGRRWAHAWHLAPTEINIVYCCCQC